MIQKDKKTQSELIALLMAEIQKHADCDHVVGVAIIKPLSQNWEAAWTVDGDEPVCRRAYAIAQDLQAKFDLA